MARADLPITDTIRKNPKILYQIRQAFGILYDEDGKVVPGNETEATILLKQIHSPEIGIPEDYTIKETGITIEKWYETLTKAPEYQAPTYSGAPEPEAKANIPGEATREEQERLRAEREAKLKETQIESKQAVEAAIKKQQEIYVEKAEKLKEAEANLKDKNIYVKVNEAVKPQLSPDEQESIKEFQDQIKANPQEAVKTIEETIRERLGKSVPKNISPEEFNIIAKQTAFEITNNLSQNFQPAIKSAVIANLASKPEIIRGIQIGEINPKDLSDWTRALSDQSLSSRNLAQIISISAFGEKFQQAVLPTISVEISTTPQAGYDRQFSLSEIPTLYSSNVLDNQQSLLGGFKNFGEAEIKYQIFSHAGSFLESQVAKLAPTHPLNIIYSNKIVQATLSRFGLGSSVDWVATNGIGRIAMSMGYGDTFGWLGEITGASGFFGIAKVASAAKTAKTALTIERTGGIMASEAFLGGAGGAAAGAVAKTGLKAVISKVTTALSTAIPVPVVNWIIGFIGGEIIGKIIEKIPWHKIKKLIDNFKDFFVGGAFALIGLGLAGTTGAFWGGIGGFLTSKAMLSSPAERAAFGRGLGNFNNALWSGVWVSIGTPILATLLVFPVVVALILFIINSGAYVVPPSSQLFENQNKYISITKTADPAGPFQNSDLPLKITYTVTISAKKNPLTNVSVVDECTIITKSGQQPCQASALVIPNQTINVGSPFTTTYSVIYNTTYKDALVSNTITATANVTGESGQQTAIGEASIIIGNPPTGCFVFDNSWSAADEISEKKAIAKMLPATTYMASLCKGNQSITLHRVGSGGGCGGGGGETVGSTINLYNSGVNCSDFVAFYTLAHESGHVYAQRTGKYQLFQDFAPYKQEGYLCTYPRGLLGYTNTPPEDFAETIALYFTKVGGSINSGCMKGLFNSAYPKHWQFARDNIFYQNLWW